VIERVGNFVYPAVCGAPQDAIAQRSPVLVAA
jgi:hypothetical protein